MEMKKIILSNMCLIKDGDKYLCQNRTKNDWPGLTLPGGKVESDELIIDSVIREVKEETGLMIKNPVFVNYIEWNIDNVRHLCMLFKTEDFEGEVINSDEGDNFFLTRQEMNEYPFSDDFDIILSLYSL